MSKGWIKLNRKITNWEWYDDHNTTRLFIHFLLKATHKESKWRGMELNPGQFVSGRKQLSLETGLSEGAIIRSIKKLKSTQEVIIKSTTKFSVFTLNNWNSYQLDEPGDQQNDQQPISKANNKRSTTDQQPITFKNEKNVKNEKNNIHAQKFELFWNSYPKRNGKRVGRKPSLALFLKVPSEKLDSVLKGVTAYSLKCGEYAKDPQRFLKDEVWKDMVEVQVEVPKRDIAAETRAKYSYRLPEGVK